MRWVLLVVLALGVFGCGQPPAPSASEAAAQELSMAELSAKSQGDFSKLSTAEQDRVLSLAGGDMAKAQQMLQSGADR